MERGSGPCLSGLCLGVQAHPAVGLLRVKSPVRGGYGREKADCMQAAGWESLSPTQPWCGRHGTADGDRGHFLIDLDEAQLQTWMAYHW